MSNHRRSQITRATAERLLTGQAVGGYVELRRTLAAASAPATGRELAAEPTAMAQFRATRLDPVSETRRKSLLKTAAAKLIAAKVVAGAAVAAAATGGVAVAAATGHLPGQTSSGAHPAAAASPSHPAPSRTPDHGKPSSLPTQANAAGNGGSHASSQSPQGSPAPSLVGLCTAYQAGVGDNPGKALQNPAFTALINKAGGKANVTTYCQGVLATAHPTTGAGEPDHSPDARSTHPSGPPTTHPSAPSTHPTGPPPSIPPGR